MIALVALVQAGLACPVELPNPRAEGRVVVDPAGLWPEHLKADLHRALLDAEAGGAPPLTVVLTGTASPGAAPCATALLERWEADGAALVITTSPPQAALRLRPARGWSAEALDALARPLAGALPEPSAIPPLARTLALPPPTPEPARPGIWMAWAFGLAAGLTALSVSLPRRAPDPPVDLESRSTPAPSPPP